MRLEVVRYKVKYSKKEQAKLDKIDKEMSSIYHHLFLNYALYVDYKEEIKNGVIYFVCTEDDKDKYYNDILHLVKKFNLEIIREELDHWYRVYVKIK